ncbi:Zn(II)2Cys6 transcription factor domain-containing protein [Aspergillus alliaceus]|uniref:Zn(II)2Cys6 transcription factor domain-containing protein n=1 Tax=Petromyces alliaceus TaxID=209559 RepID=UPI0012A417E2|nr:uncharacterized protein BDW43DRAFT_273692 [Aspergillus alliaceus]KAB8234263.1 hypothetical protein BDW43DRAFT_273692 [Aspergillus alliaceus]
MCDGDAQTVLRCSLCNKPFDKESTLKRHGYYCRSRRVGTATRSRSCVACARGKARCDNRRPECSRCIAKAIECHYPANTNAPKRNGPRTRRGDDALTEGGNVAPSLALDFGSVENRQASNDDNITLDSTLVTDAEIANIGGEYLDWGISDINFVDFLNPQMDVQVQEPIPSPSISMPPIPTYMPRLLIQRPKRKAGAQRTSHLIMHTLKSYLRMIMRHNTLPPFIHPHSISHNVGNNSMDPLSNCISLVHMIDSEAHTSRKLFWQKVRLECELLCEEHRKLNEWDLLGAMQALSIYILVRLDEGETDYNNLDFLLLATVTILAKQLSRKDFTDGTRSSPGGEGPQVSWNDWIFEESRRRLSVIYRIVNMLVYFEPAAMCDLPTHLILAPLPARKQLWEAGNESAWRAESDREPGVQTAFGLAADGELVKLDDGHLYSNHAVLIQKSSDARALPKSTIGWEEWCSGMDGFGGLVMLTASMIV